METFLRLMTFARKKDVENSGLIGTRTQCDTGAVLHQLSYHANWQLVIMWVYDKPVDMRFN